MTDPASNESECDMTAPMHPLLLNRLIAVNNSGTAAQTCHRQEEQGMMNQTLHPLEESGMIAQTPRHQEGSGMTVPMLPLQ